MAVDLNEDLGDRKQTLRFCLSGGHDGCEALSQEHPAAAPQILVH